MKSYGNQKGKGIVVGKTSILIVEDDFIVAKVIEKSLIEIGYQIAGMVSSGPEAIAAAEKEQPDLILMDINLQGDMDGITAAEKIQSRQNIPVVFLTAFSDQRTFSRALETAPYGYIIKPFQTNTLATTIEVALKKFHQEARKENRYQWLEGALQSISEGLIAIDASGNITLMSPIAENLTGWTADAATGQPVQKILLFFDPASGKRGTIMVDPVLKEGMITTVPDGVAIISKTGSQKPVAETIVSPVRGSDGTIAGAVIIIYSEARKTVSREGAATPNKGTQLPGGKTPESVKATASKEEREPGTADEWNDRGNTLMFLRKYEDAVTAYDRAISLNSTNYQAWYGRGTALAKIGENDEALAAYDHVLILHPRNHQVLMAKGVLLRKAGKSEEADRCFELAHLYLP